MYKKRLIISTGLFVIIAAIICLIITVSGEADRHKVLNFIKKNPDKSSMTIILNGEELIQYNADRKMPLASVVKILVALEYANQAANKKVDPMQMVHLDDLNRYYIPKLDGGAQPEWEKSLREKNLLKDSSVSLKEVAKGMIDYSSNANMEFLMELLGIENINQNIKTLGLTEHEEIYPFYSSLLIPYSLMSSYNGLNRSEKIQKAKIELKEMSLETFRDLAAKEHENLKNDVDGAYIKGAEIEKWYDNEFDRMNSDRMAGATTRDYGILLSKLNSYKYLSKEVKENLDGIMEGPMESEGNKERFLHLSFKGGSTNYILNSAIYAVDKDNNSIEIAFFTNNLSKNDMKLLSKHMNEFLYSALTSKEFQDNIVQELK